MSLAAPGRSEPYTLERAGVWPGAPDKGNDVSEPWLPAEHGSEQRDLQRRVARGLTWTIVDTWGSQALNLGIFVVLARLLTPVDFGLVALAAVFVALAQLLVDQGLGDALIQRPQVTRSHIDTAFWVAVVTGTLLMVSGLLLAEPIAGTLHEPELAPILRVLALSFVLSALASIPAALLRRELAFRRLAMRAILAAGVGGVVSVAMAIGGFGAWALVGQQVAAAAVSVIVLWGVTPWRPGWRISLRHFGELFSFGAHIVGSDLLNFLSRNVDNLLIGVVLGPVQLGLYAIGYRILTVTQTMLVTVAVRITFPAFARLQHDPERMRRAYFRVSRAGSLVILPGYVGLALVAPELTVAVFGERWIESGAVAAILFLIGPVLTIQAFSGSLLNATGHPNVLFRFRLISSVVNVLGFLIAVPFGIHAVAAAFVVRAYLLLPLIMWWVRVYVGIGAREYLAQLRGVAAATAVMVVCVLSVKLLLGDQPRLVLLGVEVVIGLLACAASLWLLDRRLLSEASSLLREVLPGSGRSSRADESAVGLATGERSVSLDET